MGKYNKNNTNFMMFCFGVASNGIVGMGKLYKEPNTHHFNGA